MNFLESLASEWYAIQGYFVRTNIKANRRVNGGWDNEIDVLAYSPSNGKLVHLECSWDALSWEKREERFVTKSNDTEQFAELAAVARQLEKGLKELRGMDGAALVQKRRQKFLDMGREL